MKKDDVKRVISVLLQEALGREELAEEAGFLYGVADLVNGIVDMGVHQDYSRETLAQNLKRSLLGILEDIDSCKATEYVSDEAVERFYKAFYRGEVRSIGLALEMLRGKHEEE